MQRPCLHPSILVGLPSTHYRRGEFSTAFTTVEQTPQISGSSSTTKICTKGLVSNLAMVSKSQVVSLCRSLLRAGRQYPDYNIREYTKRRTLAGFRMNKNITDQSKASEAYAEGKAQIEVVERVLKVYSAYPPKTKNIMEIKLK